MNIHNAHKIPILSFYSGGGFLDMGFEQAGFEIVWTNEYDKDFSELHSSGMTAWRQSIGNTTKAEIFNTKSITEISSAEIILEAFPKGIPDIFGIIGGPPCQDFSLNGKLKGFEGERGKLTTLYLNKILELKPSFFVMENVPGLIKRKETNKYLQSLMKIVKEEYIIDYKILNSLDFGVPQFRERIFFIGIKKSKVKDGAYSNNSIGNGFTFPENSVYKNAASKYVWAKPTPFGSVLKKPANLPFELCVDSCLVAPNETDFVPNANEFFNLYIPIETLQKINEGETNRPSFKRLHRFKYSPTACYGNNEVHLHPYLHRRLSVRETLRIQGVPDTYVLPKSLPLSKKFKMIGNGVPVPLARAVAIQILEFLNMNIIQNNASS